MKPAFNDADLRSALYQWWNGLTDMENGGLGRRRGPLARLRRLDLTHGPAGRAPDVVGAMMEADFRDLCRRIDPLWSLHDLGDNRVEDLVTVAVTLSRIRDNIRGKSPAQLLGGRDDSDRAMKEGRFTALMRAETSADLFDQARRLPDLLEGKAPVGELGASLLLWRSQSWVRRNWARDYFHLDLNGRERGEKPEPVSP